MAGIERPWLNALLERSATGRITTTSVDDAVAEILAVGLDQSTADLLEPVAKDRSRFTDAHAQAELQKALQLPRENHRTVLNNLINDARSPEDPALTAVR